MRYIFDNDLHIHSKVSLCSNDPERTNHIRLDKIRNSDGQAIPKEKPYAVLVESNTPIVCQRSRMDVSTSDMTLMTTMAY